MSRSRLLGHSELFGTFRCWRAPILGNAHQNGGNGRLRRQRGLPGMSALAGAPTRPMILCTMFKVALASVRPARLSVPCGGGVRRVNHADEPEFAAEERMPRMTRRTTRQRAHAASRSSAMLVSCALL